MPITDPLFYLFAVTALLIVGISKGGFGGGLGVLSVPMFSMVIDPLQAAVIALPVLCVLDLISLHRFRGRWDNQLLLLMVPAALIGIALGGIGFHVLTVAQLRLLIGVIAVVFALEFWLFRSRRIPAPPDQKDVRLNPSRPKAVFWCAMSGFTSTAAHAGGPPLDAWMLRLGLNKTLYQATTVAFYTVVNFVKLIPYFMLGQFTVSNLSTSLMLLPGAVVGLVLGFSLHKRLPELGFYRLCYAFLLLVGLKLLYDGLA